MKKSSSLGDGMYLETDHCKVMVQHYESTERRKGKLWEKGKIRDGNVIIDITCSHLRNYSLISVSTCRLVLRNKLQEHKDSS